MGILSIIPSSAVVCPGYFTIASKTLVWILPSLGFVVFHASSEVAIIKIYSSYQGLLLESAQALDEKSADPNSAELPEQMGTENAGAGVGTSPLANLANFNGVEFIVEFTTDKKGAVQSYGIENPEQIASWGRTVNSRFSKFGEKLQTGDLNRIEGIGPHSHIIFENRYEKKLLVGFRRSLSVELVRETVKSVIEKWGS